MEFFISAHTNFSIYKTSKKMSFIYFKFFVRNCLAPNKWESEGVLGHLSSNCRGSRVLYSWFYLCTENLLLFIFVLKVDIGIKLQIHQNCLNLWNMILFWFFGGYFVEICGKLSMRMKFVSRHVECRTFFDCFTILWKNNELFSNPS
jgi:hypothetical protein